MSKEKKNLSQPELVTEIQAKLGDKAPSKADIAATLRALATVCHEQVRAGLTVTVPEIARIKAVRKAATAARQGINPLTKKPLTIAAKPESTKVRVSPVKTLKVAISGA